MAVYHSKSRPKQAGRHHGQRTSPARGCANFLTILAQLGIIALLLAAIAGVSGYLYMSRELAGAIDRVVSYQGQGPGGTPRFYDRHGNLLFEVTTVEKRRWLTSDEMPAAIRLATVAVEDDTFWTNPGFDPAAIAAALLRNYQNEADRPVGASTITQQLVRHIAFTYEERVTASYDRKAREIFLAFVLTRQRSKEEILTMYLNEIYYGNLAYGIEAAAQTYFGIPAAEISLAQAAFLAGLPQSPLLLDPFVNFDGAKTRQAFILELMLLDEAIDQAAFDEAIAETVTLAPLVSPAEAANGVTLEAAHFILYVQNELERRYGPEALIRGGWQVTTSLDLNIHRFAELAAREQVAARQAAHDVNNAGVVVLKPDSGEILAMVGSLDYYNEAIDGQVNVTLQPRQPGSSIKPITYAAAMTQGWTMGDVLWDVPIVLDLGGGQQMVPVNYDGRYHGPVLMRDALANSYNIPPIELMRDIGIPVMINTARKMGIDSLREQPGYYGLALTLGGGEVPLLEMTRAYATLANMGQRPTLTTILHIEDSRGGVVFDLRRNQVPPANALDPRIAYIITDILDDDQARAPAMGRNNALALPFPAAAKTGTTNDYRDNWTLGYTPGVVVGIWMGNTDGHPMVNSSGLIGAAPVWRRIVEGIYADPDMFATLSIDGQPPPSEFPPQHNVEEREVCLPHGAGGPTCSASRTDLFLVGGPARLISRLGYQPDYNSVPGAWRLTVTPLAGEQQGLVNQPPLADGTQPPTATICVLNTFNPPETATVRLFLPVPSYYPDEVRARLWGQARGYVMAPPSACSHATAQQATQSGQAGSDVTTGEAPGEAPGGNAAPPPVNANWYISVPAAGDQVSGLVSIVGTANFSSSEVQYYKLEIASRSQPNQWTTFGSTHSDPVINGTLEQLHAYALPPGEYSVRLVVVRRDGNFPNPYTIPITIVP